MSNNAARLQTIYDEYGADDASLAWRLCDRHDPETVAYTLVDGDSVEHFSYGRLRSDSTRLANGLLSLGIGPGDRVGTLLRKGPELITTILAIWRVGAVYVPLFTAFAAPAVDYRLRAAQAKIVITDPVQRQKLVTQDGSKAPWRIVVVGGEGLTGDVAYDDLVTGAADSPVTPFAQGPDGPIVHIFTSGTTGLPKGVIHPLRYVANWESYHLFGLGVSKDDVFWSAADPGWAYGLYTAVVAPLAVGSGTILQVGAFNADATWTIIDHLAVTNFTAAPTVFRALRNAASDSPRTTSLRRLSSAGEPLTPDVNTWASDALGLLVHDHYGQTEAGMIFANHHHPEYEQDIVPGSMGQTLPGWSAKVLDEETDDLLDVGDVGRIVIDLKESPMMTFESYQDPSKTSSRFTDDRRYYILGDLGQVDVDGYFRFSSRDDDVILMAGYRIGPFEVESVISQHPAVAECAVIGAPDEARGEVLEAYVVLRPHTASKRNITEEIQQLVKTRYAAHAYPRVVHVIEQLPKTPSGKIQRFILRDQRRAEVRSEGAR